MDFSPEDLLKIATGRMAQRANKDKKRLSYFEGEHELPYAPKGVNAEYEELRDMARVPLVRLAMLTPCQRLRIDGIRTGKDAASDELAWSVWQANRMDARQRAVYLDALVYGRGVVSVWPNPADPTKPLIQPEDATKVHVEPNPANPYEALWAVKRWAENRRSAVGVAQAVQCATVYFEGFVWRYEAQSATPGQWDFVEVLDNPLGRVPFVVFAPEMASSGKSRSLVDALIPMQRAVDTMRFNLLLAAQFAAFRQRVVVGFDPVMRDEDGNVVVRKDADGQPLLDENGQQIPVVASPGRAGVDRLLVFPGEETKVFDLAESNLSNYVTALDMLLATFASTAQVPPQYLVGDFKNVSGDLMVATEATLLSFVADLQTAFGEAWEQVLSLAVIAMGADALPIGTEVVWADAAPKDISSVAMAMSQMVPNGAPARMFLEMLPGATQQKVNRWMGLSQDALQRALAGDLAGALTGPKEASDDSDASATGGAV